MNYGENPFVGPGKVFETEEEQFAEYIEMMEWATQVAPEEVERFYAPALRRASVNTRCLSSAGDTSVRRGAVPVSWCG